GEGLVPVPLGLGDGRRRRLRGDARGNREGDEPERPRRDECDPTPHRVGVPVNVARTRPATVVVSFRMRTSSAVPLTTAPSRERRTGASVESHRSAPCHWSTLVSSRKPALEVSTPFRRVSTLPVGWNRSPSSPTRISPARRLGSLNRGLCNVMSRSVVPRCNFGTSLSQPTGGEKRKRRTLDDFRSQDVVHVDEADGSALTVDDHEARDLPRP